MIYCSYCRSEFDNPIRFQRKWCCPRCLCTEIEDVDPWDVEILDSDDDPDCNYEPWDM